jgi:RNase P subunit RPR2
MECKICNAAQGHERTIQITKQSGETKQLEIVTCEQCGEALVSESWIELIQEGIAPE